MGAPSPSLIKINAPIKPVPFKRVMTQGKRRFNSARYTEFKDELGFFALKAMNGREPLQGAIKLSAEFYKRLKKFGIELEETKNEESKWVIPRRKNRADDYPRRTQT